MYNILMPSASMPQVCIEYGITALCATKRSVGPYACKCPPYFGGKRGDPYGDRNYYVCTPWGETYYGELFTCVVWTTII